MIRPTKKQIYRACEKLELGEVEHSCIAISQVGEYKIDVTGYHLFHKGSVTFDSWFNAPSNWITKFKHERIMCLLMYLEARDDVLIRDKKKKRVAK